MSETRSIEARLFILLKRIERSSNCDPSIKQEAIDILSSFQLKRSSADEEAYFDALDNGEIE